MWSLLPARYGVILSLILLMLTACSGRSETAATPTPLPAIATTVPTVTVVSPPSDLVDGLATPEPALLLPIREETTFNMLAQLGGTVRSLALDGDIVYLGAGPRLSTVDISDPAAPRFLWQSDPLPDIVDAVAVLAGVVYVRAGSELHIFDLSERANPTLVGSFSGVSGNIIPAGDIVYTFASGMSDDAIKSLVALDIRNPMHPVEGQRRDLAFTAAVTASGGILYIVNEGKLQLFAADNLDGVLSEIELEFKMSFGFWRYFLTVVDNHAYIGVTDQPLQVWDVSNPAQPVQVAASQVILPQSDMKMTGNSRALFIVEMPNMYGDCDYILRVIDITDVVALGYTTEFEPQGCVSDTAVQEDILVAAAGHGGLQIFDSSNPANLTLAGNLMSPAGLTSADQIALNQDVVYIISSDLPIGKRTTLHVLTLDQAAVPKAGDVALALNLSQGDGIARLYVRGNRLYVMPWISPMLMFDISQPANPRQLTHRFEEVFLAPPVPSLTENLLYAPVGDDLGIVDLSDPDNPVVHSTFSTWPEGLCDLSIAANYLIAASCAGVTKVLYDIGDPLRPVEAGRLELPDQFGPYTITGDIFFYASNDTKNLIALDISDPANPKEFGRFPLSFDVRHMFPVGEVVYLSTDDGIWEMNVSDRTRPYLAGHFPGNNLVDDGDLLVVAAGDAGLFILQVEK